MLDQRAKAALDTCVHCGLCLEACPTYRELSIEADSPRGRIHLIRNLDEGLIQPSPAVVEHLDLCLGCRACETACPSGVAYGSIIEDARAKLEPIRSRPLSQRMVRNLVFRQLLPHSGRLRMVARAIRFAQRLRLDQVTWLIPKALAAMAGVAIVPNQFGRDELADVVPAVGTKRYTVAFVTGCVMDVMFGPTNLASVRVLARNGCEVHIPKTQTCCGALQLHAGDRQTARELARRNIETFLNTGADYIIINAAGCGSTLKEYHHLFDDDPAFIDQARAFIAKVRDIGEFLGSVDLASPGAVPPTKVAYQDACHLAHGQGVRLQPRQVLTQIPGVELVQLAEPETCCGSAGVYNLTQPEMAGAVLDRKLDTIIQSGARVVVSGNPGCILQIRQGVKQRGLQIEVLHLIDLLDRAYSASADASSSASHSSSGKAEVRSHG